MTNKKNKLIILDAGAIINDPLFSFSKEFDYILPSSVFSELKDLISRLMADNALKNKILSIKNPSQESVEKAKQCAKKLNTELSGQDMDVLALAIETNAKVITDDYSLQNVLSSLKIPFKGIMHKEIKKHFVLKKKCPDCGTYLKNGNCRNC